MRRRSFPSLLGHSIAATSHVCSSVLRLLLFASWLAIASSTPARNQTRLKNPDPLQFLKDLNWTCLVPVEENVNLSKTDPGKYMRELMFAHFDNFEEEIDKTAGEVCEKYAKQPGSLIPSDVCKPEVRRLALLLLETAWGRPECGNYSASDVDEKCDTVPPGYFCAKAEAEDPKMRPNVCMLVNTTGKGMSLPCPPGFFCSGGSAEPITCPKGWHCPKMSSSKLPCTAGFFCPVAVKQISCNQTGSDLFWGLECQNDPLTNATVVPIPCPAGAYCTAGKSEECPKDHFCPRGSGLPEECVFLEHCPEGSGRPNRMLKWFVETAFVLFLIILGFRMSRRGGVMKEHVPWLRWGGLGLVICFLMVDVLSPYLTSKLGLTSKQTNKHFSQYLEVFEDESVMIPHALLVCCAVALIYGSHASPKLRSYVGERIMIILEQMAFITFSLVLGLVIHDFYAGLFCGLLLPAVQTAHYISVGTIPRSAKIVMLAGAVAVLLPLLVFLQEVRALRLYVFGIPVLIIGDVILQCLMSEDNVAPDVELFSEDGDQEDDELDLEEDASPRVSPNLWAMTTQPAAGLQSQGWNGAKMQAQATPPLDLAEKPPADSFLLPLMRGGSRRSRSCSMDMTQTSSKEDPGICFELLSVSLTLPSGQRVLNDITLSIPAGSSVAVMGPSGCGKTSITNVLSGRAGYGNVHGLIRVNGRSDISVCELAPVTGFVPQDDVMHKSLTVEENVKYSAQLRLPLNDQQRSFQVVETVHQILHQLGLDGNKLRHTVIGDQQTRGVSGGQRKRVSFAMEFVSKPSLLFLDEPTSGLDSTTAHSVVEVFTRAARLHRCTTLAVIHQPRYETLMLFDRIILLASGGFLVFSGPVIQLEDYFKRTLAGRFPEKSNPADVVMDLISLESAKRWMERGAFMTPETPEALADTLQFGRWLSEMWQRHSPTEPDSFRIPLPALTLEKISWGEEVWIQIKRALVQLQRNRMRILLNNMMMGLALFGYCVCAPARTTEQELFHPTFAFFLLMLSQGAASHHVFGGDERYIVWREAGARINTALCFVGRDIAAMLEMLMSSFVFTTVYWAYGPLMSTQRLLFWCSFTLVYATWGLNYGFSVMLPLESAQMVSACAAFVCLFVAGVHPTFNLIVTSIGRPGVSLMALSPLRWALGYVQYDHVVVKPSALNNTMVQHMASRRLNELGMPLNWISTPSHPWGCRNQKDLLSCADRFMGDPANGRPPNSFVCSLRQLLFLGTYFRAVALLCMLITARLKAQGGGRLFADPWTSTSKRKKRRFITLLCESFQISGRSMRNVLACFLVLLTHVEVTILLHTK